MNINEATSWILRRGTRSGPYSLEKISYLLEELGNPQYDFASVLVGGTNGKGSVCAILNSILLEAEDYTVGCFTSPHLISMKERIIVGGQQVSDKLWCQGVKAIQEICKIMDKEASLGSPAFFEVITALCFWIFRELEVDLAILEVGLGGRFDSTNACSPEVSIITNIGTDHMEYLGDTKEKIALEKLGVVRRGRTLVTVEEDETILEVIKAQVAAQKGKLEQPIFSDYFQLDGKDSLGHQITLNETGEKAHFPMLGAHQLKNLAVARGAVEQLRKNGFVISGENVARGIEKVAWPGRLQWLDSDPKILLDGAHNPESIESLAAYLQARKDEGEADLNIIFGALKDKDVALMAEKLAKFGRKRCFVSPRCARRVELEDFQGLGLGAWLWEEDLKSAVEACKADNDGQILICGSLYLISEALNLAESLGVHKSP
jgi:dihydrofolate synthase/folylpolyglutamate synthase